jgi:hypothetical protein
MYQRRKVVKVAKNGNIAVVDQHLSVFGKPRFTAGTLVEEMRAVTVCKTHGVFGTEQEAIAAATAALPNGDGQ